MSSIRPSSLTPPTTPRVTGKRSREVRPIVASAIAALAPRERGAPKKLVVAPSTTKTTGKRKREDEPTEIKTSSVATSLLQTMAAPLQSLYRFGSSFFSGRSSPTPSPVTDLLQSPVVKIARWQARRTPGGGIRVTPRAEQKSKLQKVDNALYVIKQTDGAGKVESVYTGSVAKSGPGVKRKNSVRTRFRGYKREVQNPKKKRPVVTALRTFPEKCEITVYREVEGDEGDLHDAEAALIDYMKEKYPDAKSLNVSDPRKEAHRTKRRKKTI